MKKHVVYIFIFTFLLQACNNSPQNIPFPQPPSSIIRPKLRPIHFTKSAPLIPVVFTGNRFEKPVEQKMPKARPRILVDFEKPFLPPDTVVLTPPEEKIFFRNITKSIPRKSIFTVPEKVNALPPAVRDNVVTGISYYNQESGIAGSVVEAIITDHNGRLWAGTEAGLCMFDGHTWEIYTTAQGLASNNITALLEDSQHNTWIGSSGGGLEMMEHDGKTLYHWGLEEGLSNTTIKSIIEDRDGNIWVATYGGGINIINARRNTLEHLEKKQGLSNDHVWKLYCGSNGNIWAGTHGTGVNIIDRKKNSIKVFESKNGLNNNAVFAIAEDKNHVVWIGTNGGGINGFLPGFKELLVYTAVNGLGGTDVFSLLADKNNNLWVGTYRSGITVIEAGKFRYLGPDQGLSSATVMALLQDERGNVWAGTNGGGLNIIQTANGNFKHFSVKQGLSDYYAYSIFEDKKHRIWIGTNGGGVNVIDRKTDSISNIVEGLVYSVQGGIYQDRKGSMWLSNYTQAVSEIDTAGYVYTYGRQQGVIKGNTWNITGDKKGSVWIVSSGDGITVINATRDTVLNLNNAAGLSNNNINIVFEDRNENMWIGTNGSGIDIIDKARKNIRHIDKRSGLSSDNILCFYEDEAGNIWIGTDGAGIDVVTGNGKTIFHIGAADGLCNDRVQSFVHDRNGIWAGTGKGMACIQKAAGKRENDAAFCLYTFGKAEGFKSVDFIPNAAVCAYDGTFFWGVGDGLTTFVPGNLEDKNPPATYINAIEVMQHKTAWQFAADTGKNYIHENGILAGKPTGAYYLPNSLTLPYNQNQLTFSFTGIAFGQEKGIQYRYILDGFDEAWSEITNETKADYRNIPPGNYIFKVAACNRSGYWSKPAEFNFRVKAPWWKTGFAYAGYVFLFVSSLVGFGRVRTRSLLKRQHQLEETVKERTAEIAEKQREIIDSIQYAATIQHALLSSEELIAQNIPEFFIFYLPKDIVAGDFYWFHPIEKGKVVFAAADCTGHGVPGAFMSLMGVNFLNEIVVDRGVISPAEILNELRKSIIRSFESGAQSGRRDGMDICFIQLDSVNKKLIYAGANNPLWILRSGVMLEFTAQKMPVGKHHGEEKTFTETRVTLEKGDVIYMFTDGYADQFGGAKGKKFKYSSLQKLLVENENLPMKEQKNKLETEFRNWKGNLEQVDDICIIGIRI